MGMPKVKPDNVIRHEMVLGRSERELLDTLTTAYTVNRVVTPITGLLSSTPGLLLVAGLALAYLERYLPPDWEHRDETQLADWFETENIALGSLGFGLGGLVGSIFGLPGIIVGSTGGSIYGSIIQEGAEEAQAAGVPKLLSYSAFGQIVASARLIKNTIDELQNQ
jgi:hypothetical protein